MNETILRFGPDKSLLGVINLPEQWTPQSPVAVILNAGIVHRVGPFRLHVDIARSLSTMGHASLRMDLSGLGDSGVRKFVPPDEDRAVLDFCDAVEALGVSCGATSFVPIGLCSGAFNAHQASLRDDRVVGAVFLDGIVYETAGHRRRRRKRRMNYRFLRNAVKRRLAADSMHRETADDGGDSEFFTNEKSAASVADEIRLMIEQRKQLLYIFTEGYKDISAREQFEEMFGITPDHGSLQVDYYKNVEHTFRLTQHRKRVVERIANWFGNRFPLPLESEPIGS